MDEPITPPKFTTTATTEDGIIVAMMTWLHARGCAVVVFTESELQGLGHSLVDADDLESMMIECGNEAIYAITGKMNTTDNDSD